MFGKMFLLIIGITFLTGCPQKPIPDGSDSNNSSGAIYPDSVVIQNIPEGPLYAGTEIQLELQFFPETVTDRTIVWSVTPAEVACIREENLLVAVSDGTANVKGVTANGKTVEFSVTVTGVAAPDSVTVDGTLYRRVLAENFVSPTLAGVMKGDKHQIADGCLKIDADLGLPSAGHKQIFSLFSEYEYNLIRVRFRLNDHNPNFRLKTTGADILYFYENETDLRFKSELFPITSDKIGQTLHYLDGYSRSENAGEFVDLDIVRTEDVVTVFIDGVFQTGFDPESFFTNPGFFTGMTEFEFGVYWGDRTAGVQGAEIDYIGLYTSGAIVRNTEISLIPEPKNFVKGDGAFVINASTKIYDESGLAGNAVSLFRNRINASSGMMPDVGTADTNVIRLVSDTGMENSEGYKLEVTPSLITVKANGYGGFLYGLYTLLQLMPPEVMSLSPVKGLTLSIPCCTVEDEPRFEHRGFMLDVSRHFFSADLVKQIIDEISLLKINQFHWHLTDDGGFRFPFHGQLTAKSGNLYDFDAFMAGTSYRTGETADSANFLGSWEFFNPDDPNDPYYQYRENRHGGYYTLDEIRSVIDYAKERNITVIPEFDIPGHSKPLYRYFKNLQCDQENTDTNPGKEKRPASFADLCASSEDILEVMDYMIGQIAETFDAPIIHVGADEVAINNESWYEVGPWWFCNRCESKMRDIVGNPQAAVNYQNLQKLQSWFLKEIEKIVYAHGKQMAIWNEGMKGNFQPGAQTYMWYWNGSSELNAAVSKNMKIVNSDTFKYYLDFYQTTSDRNAKNPDANDWGGSAPTITLELIYNNDLTRENSGLSFGSRQIGVQANMWTERIVAYTKNGKHYTADERLIYMIFPRIAAVAERAWSPESKKDYSRFLEKMQVQFKRFAASGLRGVCEAERVY